MTVFMTGIVMAMVGQRLDGVVMMVGVVDAAHVKPLEYATLEDADVGNLVSNSMAHANGRCNYMQVFRNWIKGFDRVFRETNRCFAWLKCVC